MNPVRRGNKRGSVRRNSIWLLGSRLSAQAIGVLFVAVAARRLGLSNFGQFTLIATLVLIGNTFTNFGTDTLLIREIARTGRVVPIGARALGLQLILSALWWLVSLALRSEPPFLIYTLALFPLAIFSVCTAILRAFERMDLFWTLSLASGLAQLIAVWLAHDLLALCIAILAGQILVAALALWICKVNLPEFRLLPFADVRPLLRATWPFAVLTILLVLAQRAGILAVSNLLGDRPTGLFSAVSRVVEGLKLGHYAVLGALLPVLSRRGVGSRQSFANGFLLLLGLSVLFGIALSMLATPIVNALYGRSFAAAAGLLPQLGWTLIPYTVSSFISYDLIARGLELTLVKIAALSLVIFVFLYLALISAFGLSGAVWAALTGECIQAVIFFLALRYRPNTSAGAAQPELIHDIS